MGMAIADYFHTGKSDTLKVYSPDFDEDEMPVDMLFREYENMSALEQKALQMADGRILDVGAGAGCHSLALQQLGKNVEAVDISPNSVQVMRERGVKQVVEQDFFTLTGRYDTILMLMNGIGIVGSIDRMPLFFKHLDELLADGGQVLVDSSDLCYLFEEEDGIIYLPEGEKYYGELLYQMQYKDIKGDAFPWLYVDYETLEQKASECGYVAEIVLQGEHYDYLARITKR